MSAHLNRELERLKKSILSLSAQVEKQVNRAVIVVSQRNASIADEVFAADAEVDRGEVDIEEDCLKIMALHQPVAIDLRFIVAVLKINNDLERIGDLAVNIAKRGKKLANMPEVTAPFDVTRMSEITQEMLRNSLTSLIDSNGELALEVMKEDDIIDEMNRAAYGKVISAIGESPEQINALIYYLGVARQLERIADHTTNIAEDVIYMVSGEIVRHPSSDR